MRRHELSDEEWAVIEPLLPNKCGSAWNVDPLSGRIGVQN